jgi:hypothetical protein
MVQLLKVWGSKELRVTGDLTLAELCIDVLRSWAELNDERTSVVGRGVPRHC